MFTFSRIRSGETEVFSVLLPATTSGDNGSRFGTPVRVNALDERYFEIGTLVLIHGLKEIEYLLFTKEEVTDEESAQMMREIELLAGKEVHTMGSEREHGWFEHDCLRDSG